MRILIVDDEPIIMEGIARVAARCASGAEIATASSAKKALEAFEKQAFDVVLLDIEMPGENGVTLAAEIRRQWPKTNLIFSTAYPEYTDRAMALHASGYILKPVTEEKLRFELEDLRHRTEQEGQKESLQDTPATAAEHTQNTPEPGPQKTQITEKPGLQTVLDPQKPRVQTFGLFEVFYDGKPIQFSYAKTKELLAYLVDKRGAMVCPKEIQRALWEGAEDKTSYLKQLRKDLFDTLRSIQCENAIATMRGGIAVVAGNLDCDYFAFLKDPKGKDTVFKGEYMSQYAWAKETRNHLAQMDGGSKQSAESPDGGLNQSAEISDGGLDRGGVAGEMP